MYGSVYLKYTDIDAAWLPHHSRRPPPPAPGGASGFQVSSYRDSLDGPVSTDQSYVFAGGMNLVTSDYNGVLPARLPQQWVSIVQCGQDAGARRRGAQACERARQPHKMPCIRTIHIHQRPAPVRTPPL